MADLTHTHQENGSSWEGCPACALDLLTEESGGRICLTHGSPLFDMNSSPQRCEYAELHDLRGACKSWYQA